MKPPYENRNEKFRGILRTTGFILLTIGVLFFAVGVIDFFAAFAGPGMPTKFWCLFVGIPLIAFGLMCLKAGFLRTITGYVAGESAPVAKDTIQYVAQGIRPSIRDIASDVQTAKPKRDAATRMQELQKLRENGLIAESEYSAKRAEILKHI